VFCTVHHPLICFPNKHDLPHLTNQYISHAPCIPQILGRPDLVSTNFTSCLHSLFLHITTLMSVAIMTSSSHLAPERALHPLSTSTTQRYVVVNDTDTDMIQVTNSFAVSQVSESPDLLISLHHRHLSKLNHERSHTLPTRTSVNSISTDQNVLPLLVSTLETTNSNMYQCTRSQAVVHPSLP
jgi:hypothetical protein